MNDQHRQVLAFSEGVPDSDGYRAALGYARRLRGDKSHVNDEGLIPGTGEVILRTKGVDKDKGIPQMCRELFLLNFRFDWDVEVESICN